MKNLIKIIIYSLVISILVMIFLRIAYPPFSHRSLWSYASHYVDIHAGELLDRFDIGSHHDTWTFKAQENKKNLENVPVIAVGGGITSADVNFKDNFNLRDRFVFFSLLLKTFCSTASVKFRYALYFAYDYSDAFFASNTSMMAFTKEFDDYYRNNCSHLNLSLHLLKCSHTKSPAWAQNDAMMEAYLDGVDYFYRVNDDTVFVTSNWAEHFIKRLSKFKPPNLGVVGPNHSGGATSILTYDFVHRTHVNVFGFYYPRQFTDWYSDTWITEVYAPDKILKLANIRVKHMLFGTRYKPSRHLRKFLQGVENQSIDAIAKYQYTLLHPVERNPKKVISMSLYGSTTSINMGAIRNAQLLPVYFPGWTLRIYVGKRGGKSELTVPDRIVSVLKDLGAQVVLVDPLLARLKPELWAYQVIKDDNVDYFIIRKAEHRIRLRDFEATEDFIRRFEAEGSIMFHCLRDKASHASMSIVPGLLGGSGRAVRDSFGKGVRFLERMLTFMKSNVYVSEERLLHELLWKKHRDSFLCHDSISCSNWQPWSITFPQNSKPSDAIDTLGVEYDRHETPLGYSPATETSARQKESSPCDGARLAGNISSRMTLTATVHSKSDSSNEISNSTDYLSTLRNNNNTTLHIYETSKLKN